MSVNSWRVYFGVTSICQVPSIPPKCFTVPEKGSTKRLKESCPGGLEQVLSTNLR